MVLPFRRPNAPSALQNNFSDVLRPDLGISCAVSLTDIIVRLRKTHADHIKYLQEALITLRDIPATSVFLAVRVVYLEEVITPTGLLADLK